MADLPRRRTHPLALAAAWALLVPALASGEPADDVEALIGTWHVLIHYRDEHTHDPEQIRWADEVWVFERSGSRLRWTRYPIVVFRDKTGRFEERGGMRAARTLRAWEPNERQRAEIASGLEVNSRGQKAKTLRPLDGAWRSTNRNTAASALVVTYVESWSIAGLPDRPVFRREDTLGSARTESLDGVEQFTTTARGPRGDEYAGDYERDESRRGRFRMTRAAESRGVRGSSQTTGQRLREQYLRNFGEVLGAREAAIRAAPDRAAARAEIRAALTETIRAAEGDPEFLGPEVDHLTGEIERRMLDGGESAADIDQLLEDGHINP